MCDFLERKWIFGIYKDRNSWPADLLSAEYVIYLLTWDLLILLLLLLLPLL